VFLSIKSPPNFQVPPRDGAPVLLALVRDGGFPGVLLRCHELLGACHHVWLLLLDGFEDQAANPASLHHHCSDLADDCRHIYPGLIHALLRPRRLQRALRKSRGRRTHVWLLLRTLFPIRHRAICYQEAQEDFWQERIIPSRQIEKRADGSARARSQSDSTTGRVCHLSLSYFLQNELLPRR